MKTICTIIGARPQFIKAAPLSRQLRKKFKEVLIHTGQHYDFEMSEIFFKELNIPHCDYHLQIGSGNHGEQTAKMLMAIEPLLTKIKPSLVIVYGDTNSTLAGALAAVKMHIPVAHIEAGMRSFNRRMPEEINRILTDHASDILFCSSRRSKQWLHEERIDKNVHVVGDIMIDILHDSLPRSNKYSSVMSALGLTSRQFVLLTLHRAENTDNPRRLFSILHAIDRVKRFPVIFPIHPRTKKYLATLGWKQTKQSAIRIIPPVPYYDMIALEKNCATIVTDSGGVQKEAYFLKKPCLTIRSETEWVETVASGWNKIVNDNSATITKFLNRFPMPKRHQQFYGTGSACKKIVSAISDYLRTHQVSSR